MTMPESRTSTDTSQTGQFNYLIIEMEYSDGAWMFFMVRVSQPSLFSFKCTCTSVFWWLPWWSLPGALSLLAWIHHGHSLDPPRGSSWFLLMVPPGSSWFLLVVPPGSSLGGLFLVVPPLVLSLWFLLGWSFPCGPSLGPSPGPSLWFPLALVLSLSLSLSFSLSLPSSCLPLL